jgi:hypothetical protein
MARSLIGDLYQYSGQRPKPLKGLVKTVTLDSTFAADPKLETFHLALKQYLGITPSEPPPMPSQHPLFADTAGDNAQAPHVPA